MGRIRAELFRAIAADAAASRAYFDTLKTTNDTPHFDGAGALENLRGQLRIFELMMRRAANYCELEAGAVPGEPARGLVKISLELTLTEASLRHPEGEQKRGAKAAHADVARSLYDQISPGRIDPEIARLLDQIENGTVLASRPEGAGLAVPLKRGRGRPRKSVGVVAVVREPNEKRAKTKAVKRRGRPRKAKA
jgi:hypothetical protein